MHKVRVFLLLLGLCWLSGQGALLYAQEEEVTETEEIAEIENEEEGGDFGEGDIALETDWDGYIPELYSRGDQTFTVALGVTFPTVFYNYKSAIVPHNFFPVGGEGSLSYNFFFNSHFFLGIEIGVLFNYTLGENTIFIIPIGAKAGWQFVFRRFEFPISVLAGIAPQRYLMNMMYAPGMIIRPEVSGFFRFSPEWSFGLNVNWNWFPQWPRKEGIRVPEEDMYANILGITLAARYHF